MVDYGTRTRTQPKVVRNALLATCHLEMLDVKSGQWITTEYSQKWRADHSFYRTMTDVCTQDFYGKIAHGQFINNPMSRDRQTVDVFPSSVVGSKISSNYSTLFRATVTDDGCSGVGYQPEPAGIQSRIDAAKTLIGTKVLAKAKSHQVQFLATLGEGKETLRMLRGGCIALLNWRKYLVSYGRQLVRAARCPKRFFKKIYLDVENAWMYCRMGIRPFLGECENLHAAISHMKEKRWRTRFATKTSLRSSASSHTSRVKVNRLYTGHFKSYYEETEVSAGVICEAKVGGYPDTFGLSQVLETAWELTPLSWLVDYFLNTGNFLAAMRGDTYWNVICSWTTVKRMSEEVVKAENASYLDYGPVTPDPGGYRRLVRERITRTPGLSIGLITLPTMDFESKGQEILDTLAVVRQKVGGLLKKVCNLESDVNKRKKDYGI